MERAFIRLKKFHALVVVVVVDAASYSTPRELCEKNVCVRAAASYIARVRARFYAYENFLIQLSARPGSVCIVRNSTLIYDDSRVGALEESE